MPLPARGSAATSGRDAPGLHHRSPTDGAANLASSYEERLIIRLYLILSRTAAEQSVRRGRLAADLASGG